MQGVSPPNGAHMLGTEGLVARERERDAVMEGRRGSGCREEGCRGEGFMWGKVHTGLILIQSSEIRQRLKQSAI